VSRIAFFDCPSGISGDMALGALLDAGAERALLDAAVEALGLGGEVRLEIRREERGHLGGLRVLVHCGEGPARTLPELEQIGQAERDAWVGHMQAAIDEAGFVEPARSALREYFERAATFLINAGANPNSVELLG